MWREIHGEGPWSLTIQTKYLGRKDLPFWFRKGKIGTSYGSSIWLSFRKIENYFLKKLIFHFQYGSKILIGKDQFLSGAEEVNVPESLLKFFHRRGLFFWDSLISSWQASIPLWKDADVLEMPQAIALQWERISSGLRNCGIFQSVESNYLIWNISKEMNIVCVKDVYQHLIELKMPAHNPVFPHIFWKDGCPSKMILCAWLTFHNKNLTWENLMKRGWHGLGLCSLCRSEGGNNVHLFFECKKSQQIWQALEICYGIQHKTHASIIEAFLWCSEQKESWRRIFIISPWIIWKCRNNTIFNGIKSPFSEIFFNIVTSFEALSQKPLKQKKDAYTDLSKELSSFPKAFYDGAEQKGSCGCGVLIMVNKNTHFSIHSNGGKGSNNKAEDMALTGSQNFVFFLIFRMSLYLEIQKLWWILSQEIVIF